MSTWEGQYFARVQSRTGTLPELPPRHLLPCPVGCLAAIKRLGLVQAERLCQSAGKAEQSPRCLGLHVVEQHKTGHQQRLDGVKIGPEAVSGGSGATCPHREALYLSKKFPSRR